MGTAAHLASEPHRETNAYAGRTGWRSYLLRRALPVLPITLFQMNAVLSSSPANLGRLVAIIADDPAMTANLLREARAIENDEPCDHLVDVVIGLGVQRLQALLLRTPLLTTTETRRPKYLAWRTHSVLSSMLAECIANAVPVPGGRVARAAGLLHDIGALPLILHKSAECSAPVQEGVGGVDDSGLAAHCQIGYEMARTWYFSERLADVIREHHGPDAGSAPLLSMVVAADHISHHAGVGLLDELTQVLGETALEEIVETTLRWLASEQQTAVAESLRRTYQLWRRSHPGVGVEEI